MTSTRISLALAVISVCCSVWLYLNTTHIQTATDARLTALAGQMAHLGHRLNVHGEPTGDTREIDTDALARRITATVMQQLRSQSVASGSARPMPATTDVATQAQRDAAGQAEQILQSALSSGVLTRADVMQMRELKLRSGGGSPFVGLTKEIFQDLNQRKLVAEDPTMIVP